MPLAALAAVGFALRAWHSDVPFQSGDFATMPYLVSQRSGIVWILRHTYGPLLPMVVAVLARAAVALGFGMTETLWRMPLILIGTLHVPVTFVLMRRLGASRWAALMAAGVVAVVPSLTNDARYPWGYECLGAMVGSLALWAWLRELDRPPGGEHTVRTRLEAWLAGGLMAAYLLSHLLIHAVPIVAVAAAVLIAGRRGAVRRIARPAVVVPVGLAVGLTCVAWFRYGGGILGRMVRHAAIGTVDAGASSWSDLARLWCEHLGAPWAAFCAVAVVVGLVLLARGDRRGLPALWTIVYILPLVLLLDITHMGRPTQYQIQGTYAASLAGCLLLDILAGAVGRRSRAGVRRFARVGVATAGVAVVGALFVGSYESLFTDRRPPAWTGSTDYGRVIPDPGTKAAGWYVRAHVPADAVVLATHGMQGLEYPCAIYYTGRHVAAGEDTTPSEQRAIVAAVHGAIDVALVEPALLATFRDEYGFSVPVRILRGGRPVLYIAARPGYAIPAMDVDVAEADARYDRQCALRHIPTPVARNERTAAVNQTIHAIRAAVVGF